MGSEVWLREAYRSGDFPIDKSEFSLDGGWQSKNDMLVSYQAQPATLTWSGSTNSDIKLVFLSHDWSGEVKVTLNGQSQMVNLYSPVETSKSIVLPVQGGGSTNLVNVFFFSMTSISISFLLLVLSMWISGLNIESKKSRKVSRWAWMIYAVPIVSACLIYLLTYWPGIHE